MLIWSIRRAIESPRSLLIDIVFLVKDDICRWLILQQQIVGTKAGASIPRASLWRSFESRVIHSFTASISIDHPSLPHQQWSGFNTPSGCMWGCSFHSIANDPVIYIQKCNANHCPSLPHRQYAQQSYIASPSAIFQLSIFAWVWHGSFELRTIQSFKFKRTKLTTAPKKCLCFFPSPSLPYWECQSPTIAQCQRLSAMPTKSFVKFIIH